MQSRSRSADMERPKSHRLSIQRTSDGRTAVAVDILGPIANPLDGLPLTDKLMLLLRPYTGTERALMKAVKGLPAIARRAVAADILAVRRDQMMVRRQQRAEQRLTEAWMEKTLSEPGSRVRVVVPTGASAVPMIVDVTPDREPEM